MEIQELQHTEKRSVPIEKQKETKSRQFEAALASLDSQSVSLSEVHAILDMHAQTSPAFREKFQSFKDANSNKLISALSCTEHTPANPVLSKRIQSYKSKIDQLKVTLSNLQRSLNESTSLSLKTMDTVKGIFTDDTAHNSYKTSFERTKSQATQLLAKFTAEMNPKTLSPDEKTQYDLLVRELEKIQRSELSSTGIIQMQVNEILGTPENLKNALHWVKWEVIGVKDGLAGMAIWAFDLLKFTAKYTFSQQYRAEVSAQVDQISTFCKENGVAWVSGKVYEALGKEMDRVSRLPSDQQAEAIGKVAGNVISMLMVVKWAVVVGEKLWKISQANRLIAEAEALENLARAERIRQIAQTLLASKLGLQAFDILATWVAESILLKGIASSYKWVSLALTGTLEKGEKIKVLNAAMEDIKNTASKTPEEQSIKERYLTELQKEIDGFGEKKLKFDITKNEIYQKYIYLQKHAEFLWELKAADVLGQWENAIIIRHSSFPDKVVKVAKPGKVDDLTVEFLAHQEFLNALEAWRKSHPWGLGEGIRIPKVEFNPKDTGWYFVMEKIVGQNLNTKFYREFYEKQLSKKYTTEYLDHLTDDQFSTIMKENKLSRSPTQAIADDVEWKILTTEMTNFYRKHLYQDAQGVHTQLRNTLWFLEWKGLQHLDIRYNPWNIMVDNTGNLYIIDFWKTNITERIRKELEVKKNLQKHP